MELRPNFTAAPAVKVLINIGAGLDIPTGTYLTGKYGESILNGGLGAVTATVGIGNVFKSTITHYMMLSAMDRIMQSTPTSASTYDTEINIHESRLRTITRRFKSFQDKDIFADQDWVITDKTVYYANEWYEILKTFLKDKVKSKAMDVETPFMERDRVNRITIKTPTFSEIDSFSEFETEDVAEIQDKNELGESGGNTIHMRQGLAKTRFLMDLPKFATGAYHYILMVAHVGKEIQMASGPMPAPPVKKLTTLKNGDKIKGVTDKFFFLMNNCWQALSASPLINQGTKGPEYPRNPDDNKPMDTDLNVVNLRQLRSKSGQSGIVLQILVSQEEGVLPELTEFHYIKESGRYGISGTLQHYSLDFYPDCKLSRTTVRSKIDTDPKLCRALNITAEMCQMKDYWYSIDTSLLRSPKEIYDRLLELGYNIDDILNTRGWWTVNNEDHPVPFLSTMDILKMACPETGFTDLSNQMYIPYWMKNPPEKALALYKKLYNKDWTAPKLSKTKG